MIPLIVPIVVENVIMKAAHDIAENEVPRHIPIVTVSKAVALECYQNVTAYIQQYGGKAVKGWQFWWIPGSMIEARAHVVLQNEDDELFDITPSSDETVCLFMKDESLKANPGIDFIQSKYWNICGEQVVDEYISCVERIAEYFDMRKTSRLYIPEPHEIRKLKNILPAFQLVIEQYYP